MRVTHAGFASVLNLVHSIYKMSSHGVFTIICKHKGYLSKTYVVLVCGKYNTSVHRILNQMLLLVLSIKIRLCMHIIIHGVDEYGMTFSV